jgi:hypothetical protein
MTRDETSAIQWIGPPAASRGGRSRVRRTLPWPPHLPQPWRRDHLPTLGWALDRPTGGERPPPTGVRHYPSWGERQAGRVAALRRARCAARRPPHARRLSRLVAGPDAVRLALIERNPLNWVRLVRERPADVQPLPLARAVPAPPHTADALRQRHACQEQERLLAGPAWQETDSVISVRAGPLVQPREFGIQYRGHEASVGRRDCTVLDGCPDTVTTGQYKGDTRGAAANCCDESPLVVQSRST